MSKPISRGTFLKGMIGVGAAALAGGALWKLNIDGKHIPCRVLGPSQSLGHMLRDGTLPPLPGTIPHTDVSVAVIGGGVAGLSAAWWLKRNGCQDFQLLELEKEVGGNSRAGENDVSKYPWAAHYVPLANEEAEYVQELFREVGVIQTVSKDGLPVYNELYLCHEPQERLFKDGQWQEGLIPHRGLQQSDVDEMARFFHQVDAYRKMVGKDGKPIFAIPLDLSSSDEQIRRLDQISFAEWLTQEKYESKPLRWYLNYCCRDDYGSSLPNVSAWAGLHYFAGRRGKAANAEMNSVVTWPEGNAFLVNHLRSKIDGNIVNDAVVAKVVPSDTGVDIYYLKNKQWSLLKAHHAIFAAPRFVGNYIIADGARASSPHSSAATGAPASSQHSSATNGAPASRRHSLTYAPWMVANITLSRPPHGKGVPLSWDNVNYYGKSLGYVNASHQNVTTRQGKSVITFYFPLSDRTPQAGRQTLLEKAPEDWCTIIVDDLNKAHPGISEDIIAIDLWPWGHGMISPSVGFIWGEERARMKERAGNLFFAHSDMSGISNFEEAQYQGVTAAKQILAEMKA